MLGVEALCSYSFTSTWVSNPTPILQCVVRFLQKRLLDERDNSPHATPIVLAAGGSLKGSLFIILMPCYFNLPRVA